MRKTFFHPFHNSSVTLDYLSRRGRARGRMTTAERRQADRLAHQRMRERMKKFLVQFHASDAETFVRTLARKLDDKQIKTLKGWMTK